MSTPVFTRAEAMKIALQTELRGADREGSELKSVAHEANRAVEIVAGVPPRDELTRLYGLLAVAESEARRLREGNLRLLQELNSARAWYRGEYPAENGRDVVYPWDHS